jgi:glycosyltransferase involved in cell wall biosynthesis
MRILLLGEYSNMHATLAQGFRNLGHEVTVASNGDFGKNYPRDIDLARRKGKLGGIMLMAKVYAQLSQWKGYDVVQLINPMFLELKAERIFPIYRYLKRHNKKVFLGAYGMDWYWVHTCTNEKPLRYSDFNIGDTIRTNADAIKEQHDWIGTNKERLNKLIAETSDGIIANLYEYWVCYHAVFPQKTTYIPCPIVSHHSPIVSHRSPLTIFIGISKGRSEYKGTDIMLQAAKDIKSRYPEKVELQIAEGLPYAQYQQMMNGSDVILDQLYSYTPSMNSLLAMSKGIVVVGGGEPECYDILQEKELHPIINVQPNYESVYYELEQLVLHPERIPTLKQQSIEFVKKHHDYLKVAQQYLEFYNTKG